MSVHIAIPADTLDVLSPEALERIAESVLNAVNARPYGCYDYSQYPGSFPAHQVKDENTRLLVGAFHTSHEANALYNKLTREYVAKTAVEAVRKEL